MKMTEKELAQKLLELSKRKEKVEQELEDIKLKRKQLIEDFPVVHFNDLPVGTKFKPFEEREEWQNEKTYMKTAPRKDKIGRILNSVVLNGDEAGEFKPDIFSTCIVVE